MPAPLPSHAGRNEPQGFAAFERGLLNLARGDPQSWVVNARVDSTNSQARRYLAWHRPDPSCAEVCCFVAWEQTEGRGRRGRNWSSTAGLGLYMSVVLPEQSADVVATLPLLVPCAATRVIGALVPTEVRVKWPNDLISSGRKLAGILVEATSCAGRRPSAVVGIGVNCFHDASQLPTPSATSLRLEGCERVDLVSLARDLWAELDRRVSEARPMAAIVEEFRTLSVHRPGDWIRCRSGRGEFVGAFAGFATDGSLLLQGESGVERIRAAEIIET